MKEWYESRARAYDRLDIVGIKRYEYAVQAAPIFNGCRIIDIGCKSGSFLKVLHESDIHDPEYRGFDISEKALELVDEVSAEISVCDVTQGLPIEDEWADRIYLLEVIEHVREPMKVMEEIARCLKPDGIAIVSALNPYYWLKVLHNIFKVPDKEGHISAFTWKEIDAMCRMIGLEVKKINNLFEIVPYSLRKPYKRGKFFVTRALLPWHSISLQYIISKK